MGSMDLPPAKRVKRSHEEDIMNENENEYVAPTIAPPRIAEQVSRKTPVTLQTSKDSTAEIMVAYDYENRTSKVNKTLFRHNSGYFESIFKHGFREAEIGILDLNEFDSGC